MWGKRQPATYHYGSITVCSAPLVVVSNVSGKNRQQWCIIALSPYTKLLFCFPQYPPFARAHNSKVVLCFTTEKALLISQPWDTIVKFSNTWKARSGSTGNWTFLCVQTYKDNIFSLTQHNLFVLTLIWRVHTGAWRIWKVMLPSYTILMSTLRFWVVVYVCIKWEN